MRAIVIAFAAVATLAAADSQLRERPAVLSLSLKRAVEIAVAPEGNARVQIADELIKQSESRAAESRAALLPNFDSSLNYSSNTRNLKTFGLDFSTLLPAGLNLHIPTLAGPFNIFDLRLSGAQSVFDFSTIRRFQASRVGVQATKADAQGTRNQVADQVARAYLAALRAEAALETAKSNVELSEALVKLANSQKAAGTGTGIEVTRAQVQLANDRQRLTVATNDRQRTHLQLMRAVGLKLDGEVELTDKLGYKPVDDMPAEQATKLAIESRPEWQAQKDRQSNARLGYSGTKWERLPSLAFYGDYGTTGTGIDSAIPTRTYGVSIKVPLFDGGRRDARREEASSQLRSEEIRTRDLKEQIELDVRVSLDSLRSADAQVTAAKDGLALAERELEQARRRYEAGVTNSIEVTDAQTRLQRARDNRIAALFAHNLARIDLNTAMGTIQDLVNTF